MAVYTPLAVTFCVLPFLYSKHLYCDGILGSEKINLGSTLFFSNTLNILGISKSKFHTDTKSGFHRCAFLKQLTDVSNSVSTKSISHCLARSI